MCSSIKIFLMDETTKKRFLKCHVPSTYVQGSCPVVAAEAVAAEAEAAEAVAASAILSPFFFFGVPVVDSISSDLLYQKNKKKEFSVCQIKKRQSIRISKEYLYQRQLYTERDIIPVHCHSCHSSDRLSMGVCQIIFKN